jgi:hypothetical protein
VCVFFELVGCCDRRMKIRLMQKVPKDLVVGLLVRMDLIPGAEGRGEPELPHYSVPEARMRRNRFWTAVVNRRRKHQMPEKADIRRAI